MLKSLTAEQRDAFHFLIQLSRCAGRGQVQDVECCPTLQRPFGLTEVCCGAMPTATLLTSTLTLPIYLPGCYRNSEPLTDDILHIGRLSFLELPKHHCAYPSQQTTLFTPTTISCSCSLSTLSP